MPASITTVRRILLAAATAAGLLLPAAVQAHAKHGQPQHGGLVAEAGAFQGELVAKGRQLTLYVTNHGEPLAMAGGSAKATLLAGADKSELAFAPAGANQLTATSPAPLAAGTKAVVTVKLPNGRSGNLRFEIK